MQRTTKELIQHSNIRHEHRQEESRNWCIKGRNNRSYKFFRAEWPPNSTIKAYSLDWNLQLLKHVNYKDKGCHEGEREWRVFRAKTSDLRIKT